MAKKYYAVKIGKTPGVYGDWATCKSMVHGYPGAVYKSFPSQKEAEDFIKGHRESPKIHKVDNILGSLESDQMIAYVDGSYQTKTGRFSYGMVYFTDVGMKTEKKAYDLPEEASHRNVAGEVHGAIAAMERAIELGKTKLQLHYDYMGIEMWAIGAWKTNTQLTKSYSAYCNSIRQKLSVNFVKVAAHSGDTYNEMADSLAKAALEIISTL